VRARLGGTFTCVPEVTPEVSHTFDFASWEDLLVRGREVSLRGSDHAEKMKVVGARNRLQGLGGADVSNPNVTFGWEAYDTPVEVSGGRGDDKLFGQTGDDTLQGGAGRDRAVGKDGRDRCPAEVRRTCESR